MAIDGRRRKPILSTKRAAFSGPAVAFRRRNRMVWQVASAFTVPVVGLGGIMSAADALEFIMAGASAIQVGTVNFVSPSRDYGYYRRTYGLLQTDTARPINGPQSAII